VPSTHDPASTSGHPTLRTRPAPFLRVSNRTRVAGASSGGPRNHRCGPRWVENETWELGGLWTRSKSVTTTNLQQIQVYRVNPDGSPDVNAINTYTPPFTQTTGGGVTIPVSTTGNFTWPPCVRHADEPSDSLGVALRYSYHPLISVGNNPSFTLAAATDQHINPTTGSTPCPIPGIPTGVYAANSSLSEPPPSPSDTITWTVVPGAASYTIYSNVSNYSSINGPGFGSSPIATVISNTLDGATQSYTYTGNTTFAPATYEVAGVNYCGEGQHSLPAANSQCTLPMTPTVITATQAVTPAMDLITYTAPWPSAPVSDTYLITQTSGPAAVAQTFTVPISPAAPLTTSAVLTSTGMDPVTYQMSSVNACGVASPASNIITRPAAPSTLATGLVGWWRFDEPLTPPPGSFTADSSPTGSHTGTLNGGVMRISGPTSPFTNAVSFDGTSGYVATVVGSGTDLPSAQKPQSISWWMKVSSTTGTQDVIALTNSASSSSLEIGVRGGQIGAWGWGGGFLVSIPVATLSTLSPPINVAAWHHYVYTFDGTTHRLYIDGTRQAIASTSWGQNAAPNKLEFGQPTSTGAGFHFFKGSLGDVRIYTRTLSDGEVLALASQP